MLIDGAKFRETSEDTFLERAIASFIDLVERKLGVTVLIDKRRIPFGRIDLKEPVLLAARLKKLGIIKEFDKTQVASDEPQIKLWWAKLAINDSIVGGASVHDDKNALLATMAEGVERHIWLSEHDHFVRPRRGTAAEISAKFPTLLPERFSSFSEEQRKEHESLLLDPSASYLWIQGDSLVTGRKTYLPAQTAAASWRPRIATPKEPLIRTQVTTGLATWPTQTGAQLRGALECVERDAYMIWWFNQLVLPRLDIERFRTKSPSLDKLVAQCDRYGLRVHVIPLLTDAPAHATCVVLEDSSVIGPRFAFGLKAHRSLVSAVEGAIMEALRARLFTRFVDPAKHYDPSKGVEHIGHRGRVHYWQLPKNYAHLEPLIVGETYEPEESLWERDSEEAHLARVVAWCKEKGYECVSVPFGVSKKNPTSWHIESVVMPELIPTHLTENLRHLGGERLKSIPKKFGYAPRSTPFIERPHPFC